MYNWSIFLLPLNVLDNLFDSQTSMNSVTPSGYKDIGIRAFEFAAKTQIGSFQVFLFHTLERLKYVFTCVLFKSDLS